MDLSQAYLKASTLSVLSRTDFSNAGLSISELV
jgi:hypothetical protein